MQCGETTEQMPEKTQTLWHTASLPTLCAQMVTPSGTPQGIQHGLPLPVGYQTVDEILAINPYWPTWVRNDIRRQYEAPTTYGNSLPTTA